MKRTQAWIFVSAVPIILFLLGVREFIDLIGFVGSIFVGVLGILIVVLYQKVLRSPVCRTHKCLHVPHLFSYALIGLFVLGMVYTIIDSL